MIKDRLILKGLQNYSQDKWPNGIGSRIAIEKQNENSWEITILNEQDEMEVINVSDDRMQLLKEFIEVAERTE